MREGYTLSMGRQPSTSAKEEKGKNRVLKEKRPTGSARVQEEGGSPRRREEGEKNLSMGEEKGNHPAYFNSTEKGFLGRGRKSPSLP